MGLTPRVSGWGELGVDGMCVDGLRWPGAGVRAQGAIRHLLLEWLLPAPAALRQLLPPLCLGLQGAVPLGFRRPPARHECAPLTAPLPPPPRSPLQAAYAKQMVKLYTNLGLKLMDSRKFDDALTMMRKAEAMVDNDELWGPSPSPNPKRKRLQVRGGGSLGVLVGVVGRGLVRCREGPARPVGLG